MIRQIGEATVYKQLGLGSQKLIIMQAKVLMQVINIIMESVSPCPSSTKMFRA